MKRLSEVCEIVGITRRTLQGYEEIELQKPTETTEGGYWLYDEAAIERLIFIQIFVEAGYERKKIKQMLDSDEINLYEELNNAIVVLKEKQKRISGMINAIENIKIVTQLPLASIKAMSRRSVSQLYSKKSFKKCLDESIDSASQYTETEKDKASIYLPVWYLTSAIGCMQNEKPTSSDVQECVVELCRYIISLIKEEDNETEFMPEELSLFLIAKELEQGIGEMLSDLELKSMLDVQCGQGAEEFIKAALKGYCELNKHIEEKYKMED